MTPHSPLHSVSSFASKKKKKVGVGVGGSYLAGRELHTSGELSNHSGSRQGCVPIREDAHAFPTHGASSHCHCNRPEQAYWFQWFHWIDPKPPRTFSCCRFAAFLNSL